MQVPSFNRAATPITFCQRLWALLYQKGIVLNHTNNSTRAYLRGAHIVQNAHHYGMPANRTLELKTNMGIIDIFKRTKKENWVLGNLKQLDEITLQDMVTNPIWVNDLSGEQLGDYDEASERPVIGEKMFRNLCFLNLFLWLFW